MKNSPGSILIVDDESSILTTLEILFTNEGWAVDLASSVKDGRLLLEKGIYDIIVTDLRLSDGSGQDILEYAKSLNKRAEVIILTAYATVKSAVDAMRLGAFDYMIKPIDSDKLLFTALKAIERKNLVTEVKTLKKEFLKKYDFHNIMGQSPRLLEALDIVNRIAETDVSALIEGENGTGKDLIARAIHNKSPRAAGPFVAINCSGINENLLESELFGHVKGSFTGAIANRVGLFEEADGGTLFLDEVGSMHLSIQAKLLRVLQDKLIQRLGSNKMLKINTRLISASNRRLADLIKSGEFREDLYYRLRVVEISLPPLRERSGDVLLLCNRFMEKFALTMKKGIKGFSHDALNSLLRYPWPGNVRELENCVESAVALCRGDIIEVDDLPKSIINTEETLTNIVMHHPMTLEDLEKKYIMETLKSTNWNQKKTAGILAIGRNTLWRKIKTYNIQLPDAHSSEIPA